MTCQQRPAPSRALVLGGGGVTGISWEVGILVGLLEGGVNLATADAIFGTSAGSFVGAALASGYDLEELFAAQFAPDSTEILASASDEVTAAWYDAFLQGGDDPQRVGAAFGRLGKAYPEPVPRARRRTVVETRLVTTTWPDALRVSAIDADTGELHVFDKWSGVSLVDAVAASGAVPGIWPLERSGGRSWVDGGMVSAANSNLAIGHDRIVVIAPMPTGYGSIPGAVDDVARMRDQATVVLISPDEQSIAAIGPNPYDPVRCGPAATAGRAQGVTVADTIAAGW